MIRYIVALSLVWTCSTQEQQTPLESRLATLEAAAETGEHRKAGLGGYNFHSVLGVGKGYSLLLVSKQHGGEIVLFDPSGQRVAETETGEILSFTVCNIDGSARLPGFLEVITDEVIGSGTAIRLDRFRLYRLSEDGIELVWQDTSDAWEPLPGGGQQFTKTSSSIHCPGRLKYFSRVVSDVDGEIERKAYAVDADGSVSNLEEETSATGPDSTL